MLFFLYRLLAILVLVSFIANVVHQGNVMPWYELMLGPCFLLYLVGHNGIIRIHRYIMVVAMGGIMIGLIMFFKASLQKGEMGILQGFLRSIMIIGSGMNFLVVVSNKGYMPIDLHAYDTMRGSRFLVDPARQRFRSSIYKMADHKTRFRFLCDRIANARFMPKGSILSVGDLLVFYALAAFLLHAIITSFFR